MAIVHSEGLDVTLSSDLDAALVAGDILKLGKGNIAYSAGVDLSGTDLLEVHLLAEFLGDPTAALKFVVNQTSTGRLYNHWGGSRIRIASSGPTGVIYEIFHNPAAGGTANYENMDCNHFNAGSGTAVLESTADVNGLAVQGNADLIAVYATYALGTVYVAENGFLDLDRDVGTLVQASQRKGLVRTERVTPTTVELYTELDYRGGTIGTWKAMPGSVLDLSRSDRMPTITDRQLHGDCTLILKANGEEPTFSGTSVNKGTMRIEYR